MTRDENCIRDLLLEAEKVAPSCLTVTLSPNPNSAELKRHLHATWLSDAGLFCEYRDGLFKITDEGFECVEAIRDVAIWTRTLIAASAVGGVTLQELKDISLRYSLEKTRDLARRKTRKS